MANIKKRKTTKRKRQLVLIGGGMTFKKRATYLDYLKNRELKFDKPPKWHRDYLMSKLGKKFEIVRVEMPGADNAVYEEWHLNFENYLKHLKSGMILIGASLGGIFLAKYLAENELVKKPKAVILIAPPYDDTLSDEDLAGGFDLPRSLKRLAAYGKKLTLMFSKTDLVVPIEHAAKYAKKLPQANFMVFADKNGHFSISEFPEMITYLKKLL